MNSKRSALCLFVLFALTLLVAAAPRAQAAYSIPPLALSQDRANILQFTSSGHVLGFAPREMYVASGSHALHVEFVDAEPATPISDSPQSDTARTAPLAQVTYPNLWRGITLSYDAPGGSIARSTYRLEPFANGEDIRLRYNAPVRVDEAGNLRIAFETGELTESAPIAWQEIDGQRVAVQVAFRLLDSPIQNLMVGYRVGDYDPSRPLHIDPTLTWNTFLGGSGSDNGEGIAVDGDGNVYVVGSSPTSWGNPVRAYTAGAYYNAFVAKLDSSGALLWNTFLGGIYWDEGRGIAMDGGGYVYVAGESGAAWGSPVRAYTAGSEAFVARLDATSGSLTWNTFLGGGGDKNGYLAHDDGYAIAVDGGGYVYVAGESEYTWGSPVRAHSGVSDAFVARLTSSGALLWNTFLGGSNSDDRGNGIAVDGSGGGNVYVAGYSYATWGSPLRAYSGDKDAFAAKLEAISGALTWNTFLGGSGYDDGYGIAVEGGGNVYVAGRSEYTWGSPVRAHSDDDAFVTKLDSSGNLTWNTFLGGSGYDGGTDIAMDGSGNVYVAGGSDATWGSPLRAYRGVVDAFAAKLDATSGALTWNTFLGGSGYDYGLGIAVDTGGNVYVAGYSNATWGSPLRAHSGDDDAFVAKLGRAPTTTTITSDNPDPSVVGQAVVVNYTVTSAGGTPTDNVTVSDGFDACTATVAAGSCTLTPTTAGAKTLTAFYLGDDNFDGSSDTEPHTVNKADTTTTIISDNPDPSVVGEVVVVNYTVTSEGGTPTGNVTVSGGGDSCTGTVDGGGCMLSLGTAGVQTLTATYEGDDDFEGSSDFDLHTVGKFATTTTITSDNPDPSVVGQAVVVNYTVISEGGTPTGNVTVSDGVDSCTVAVGAGACTLTPTSAGAETLTATYAGDANFNGSSDTEPHTVNRADTTTTITYDDPDPSVVGQDVVVGYTVMVDAPGSGTPTGNVTISDGVDSCTVAVDVGACTLTLWTAGTRTLTASYTGDANFYGSSGDASHTVNLNYKLFLPLIMR